MLTQSLHHNHNIVGVSRPSQANERIKGHTLSTKKADVYGIGHALVDLQYSVSDHFLDDHGITKGVMTLLAEEEQHALCQALGDETQAASSGGSAANTMIAIAQYGGRAHYSFKVGDDDWGRFYREDLERAGVTSGSEVESKGTTGKCLVMVTPDADRTLNTFLGMSSEVGPGQLEAEVIDGSDFVYVEGYLVTSDTGHAAGMQAMEAARSGGTAVALTLSDPAIVGAFTERFQQLLSPSVDLLFCNEDEAGALTGASDRSCACLGLKRQATRVCMTCGADGALIMDADDELPQHVAGFPVDAIDTTGAGDAFAGGVLFGLTHGYGLKDAAVLGNYAAAEVVSDYGPRLLRSLQADVGDILKGADQNPSSAR
jgi:sugar/nucleoside kinase (ribokinase family)